MCNISCKPKNKYRMCYSCVKFCIQHFWVTWTVTCSTRCQMARIHKFFHNFILSCDQCCVNFAKAAVLKKLLLKCKNFQMFNLPVCCSLIQNYPLNFDSKVLISCAIDIFFNCMFECCYLAWYFVLQMAVDLTGCFFFFCLSIFLVHTCTVDWFICIKSMKGKLKWLNITRAEGGWLCFLYVSYLNRIDLKPLLNVSKATS